MKKNLKRVLALSLTGVLGLQLMPQAFAAPPQTQSDETLYLTMDYYGVPTESSVVKSYQVAGADSITDYGTYTNVTNMTNYAEPETGDGTVTFHFDENDIPAQFYFEGTLPEAPTAVLPWTIDVGYKLNGVEKKAEDLAGAEGLVEISIHCEPNTGANTYFKNNMILMLTAVIDRDSTLSLEAPGAQMQTLGSKQIAVFACLPGEKQDFTLRIGSDDFEFAGLIGMMAPATLSQLDQISDLRDAKDTIKDSADAASDSMDVILNTLSSLQGSLNATSNGLSQLDDARASVNSGKGSLQQSADNAIAGLSGLSDALEPMSGHLATAQSAVTDINQQLNDITGTLSTLHTELADTRATITAVQNDVTEMQKMLQELDDLADFRTDLSEEMRDDTAELQNRMDDLENSLSKLETMVGRLPTVSTLTPLSTADLEQLQTLFSTIEANYGAAADTVVATNYPQYLEYYKAYKTGQINMQIATIQTLNGTINETNTIIATLNATVSALKPVLKEVCGDLSDTTGTLGSGGLTEDLNNAIDLLDDYMEAIDSRNDEAQDLLQQLNAFGSTFSSLTVKLDTSLTQITELQNIFNSYEPSLQQTLEDGKTAASSISSTVTSSQTFLSTLRDLLRKNSDSIDSGLAQSLQGMISVLNRTVSGLSQTGVLQNAKDTIKDTVDDKWDEFSGDTSNLLNMDSEASAVSLTSAKNTSPNSIQIVLRTEEITTPDEDTTTEQDETWEADGNVFTRIAGIFKKIVSAVKNVFS